MRRKGLRYQIGESDFTLLGAGLVCATLWTWGGVSTELGVGFLLVGLTAFVLVDFNNSNALLRVRSRMVSSVYLVLMGVLSWLHAFQPDALLPLCVLGCYYLLFRTYQSRAPQGYAFHAFLCIGLGTLIFPRLLLFVPFYWLAMLVQLRSLTLRSFTASLLGLALPLWLVDGYHFVMAEPLLVAPMWHELSHFSAPDFAALTPAHRLSAAVVGYTALAAVVHFRHTRFNDKIRTRMLFYVLMMQVLLQAVFMALQPQQFEPVFRLFVLTSSPLIAHHLTLATGRWGTFHFYFVVVLFAALAVLLLWPPSQLCF